MKNIRQSQSGAAIVEFALILPIILLILMGILEFGLYFLKAQIAQRAVSTTANSLQANPLDPDIENNAYASNTGFINFNTTGNYICAQSYSTQPDANAGRCNTRVWNTAAPSGHPAGTPYYIAIVAFAAKNNLAPLMDDYVPDATAFQVVRVGGGTNSSLDNMPTGAIAGKCEVQHTFSSGGSTNRSTAIPPAVALGGTWFGSGGTLTSPKSGWCGCTSGWTSFFIGEEVVSRGNGGRGEDLYTYSCIKN